MYKVAPLKTSFMVTSIVLFLFSALYLWNLNRQWAAAIGVLAIIMFVGSMISMARGPIEMQMPRKQRKLR